MKSAQPLFRIFGPLIGVGIICLTISRIARGWGAGGHQFVAALAVDDLPPGALKDLYQTNLAWLERNSSFPDRWAERDDQAEPLRHYLHPEAFGFGSDVLKVPRDYAAAIKLQSYEQLRGSGVLPWTVERHYNLLVDAWSGGEWDDVLFESAMLSHYVADAHVPFHATINSDGQLSDPPQTGIDNRFESGVVDQSIRLSDLTTGTPATIRDPREKTLEILQDSARLVPPILDADRRAAATSEGVINGVYWSAFIPVARPIAMSRLQTAGESLAGMLTDAWKEAGSPKPPPSFLMSDRYVPYAPLLRSNPSYKPSAMPEVTMDAKDSARDNAKPIKITSKVLNRDVDAEVLLPADYDSTKRRYPVLYLLHGSSGSERDWVSHSGIAAYVQSLSIIVVMPDGGNTWYVNSPGQGNYEDFFTKELIPTIDRTLRTRPLRAARAIAGNSMGGYGAWRVAVDHPYLFSAAASLSGALDMGVSDPHDGEPHDWITTLYGGVDANALREYGRDSLYPRLARLNWRSRWHGPSLYFDAGSDDYLLAGDHHMEQFLLEQNIPYEFAEFSPGDHSWSYWDEHIRDVLQFILRHLAPPTPF